MKRKLVIITMCVLMVVLAGCGKSGGSGGGKGQDEAKLPKGLYMLAYYCDENGE